MVENIKTSLIKILNNKELKKGDLKLLKSISKKFPYFIAIKVLKLVLAKKHKTIDYEKILKSTAVNITDRIHLYNILNNDILNSHEKKSLLNDIKNEKIKKENSFLDWISNTKPTPHKSKVITKNLFSEKSYLDELRVKKHDLAKKIKKHDYMTETLAKIYIKQEKFEDALKAYKILSLKYPEKISLFADQIKTIKKLIKK